MSDIEWTDETVNVCVGCTRVSPGCEHCYAEIFVHRKMQKAHVGLTVLGKGEKGPRWNGEVRFLPERLAVFQKFKSPKKIFVNSLSDTFHEKLTHSQRAAIFGSFLLAPQHTYQVLTKRPENAIAFEKWLLSESDVTGREWWETCLAHASDHGLDVSPVTEATVDQRSWWLGVTTEDQKRAEERVPLLLRMRVLPTLRFVSYEPAIGPVDFDLARCDYCGDPSDGISDDGAPWCSECERECSYHHWLDFPCAAETENEPAVVAANDGVAWVIVGGEAGPGARPFDINWAREVVKQCRGVGTAVFVKQMGAKPFQEEMSSVGLSTEPYDAELDLEHRKGADMSEWPEDLRIREFPT